MKINMRHAFSPLGAAALLLTLSTSAALAEIQFQDVTSLVGITHTGETYGTGFIDADGDGYPDIYADNHQWTPTVFYFNQAGGLGAAGGRQFDDLADQALIGFDFKPDTHSMASADWDNDGDKDIMEVTGAGYLFPMWENDGSGTFLNRSGELGFNYPETWARPGRMPVGGRAPLFFDIPPMDGLLDVLIMARDNYPAYRTPTAMFRQQTATNGDSLFVIDESTGVDLVNDVACHYAVLAELTGDGVQDVICSDSAKVQRVWDVTQLPFRELRNVVGDALYNAWPYDLAVADFNGDLRTDLFAPTAASANNVASTVSDSVIHAWFDGNAAYDSGFNFSAVGAVTFEFDWWSAIDEIFIGAAGTQPASSSYQQTYPGQFPGAAPRHILFTLTAAQAQGLAPRDPNVGRGVYIGVVNGQWQVRLSGIDRWNVGLVVRASTSVSQLSTVGGIRLGQPTTGSPYLLLQNASHQLVDSSSLIQSVNRSCNSAAAGDLDNDMDVDVYVGCTGDLSNLPNVVYENQGDGSMVPVPQAGGGEGQMPEGRLDTVNLGDYDNDGRLDVLLANGHLFRPFSYAGRMQLLRNTGASGNHWIQADLEGVTSNRDGIGAIVYASTPDGKIQLREQGNGVHKKAQDFPRIHFGLAQNTTVNLEVHWPSGVVDNFNGLAADQIYNLVEGTGGSAGYVLSAGNVTVDEGAGSAVFTVNLSPAPGAGESVVVSYQTQDGSALAGSDYTTMAGTLTFTEGQTQDTVAVPIIDDVDPEGNESFTLNLSSADTNAVNATGTILDDDGGSTLPECGEPAYDKASESAMFVWNDCGTNDWHVRVTAGGQTLSYQGSLTSDAGFTTMTAFSYEGNDVLPPNYVMNVGNTGQDGLDFSFEAGAGVCLTLNSPSLPVYAGSDRVLMDNAVSLPDFGACDAGGFILSAGDVTVTENAGSAMFTVNLSPAPGAGESVVVSYQTQDGSALAGSDYTTMAGTLTFTEGQTQDTVAVPIIDDVDPEGNESFTLNLSSADTNAVNATGTILDDDGGSTLPECGEPAYDKASESAMFVWNDCGTNDWHVRVTAGGQTLSYQGSLTSDAGFTTMTAFSYEGNDVLPPNYVMNVGNTGQDGLDFSFEAGAGVCLTLNSPSLPVYAGANRVLVDSAVSLPDFGSCGGGGPTLPACGQPSYDKATETAAFIWNDCGTDDWHVRVTAGGQVVSALGSLTSDQAFASLAAFSYEANDVLPPNYVMNVGNTGQDGLDFAVQSGAEACFTLDAPSLPVYAGADRVLMSSSVSTIDYGACTPLP